MGTLLQDIRFGIRQLVKMPGFTLTAILSLALGIGATTAVFSVVYAILLDPYPYKDPSHMIHMRLLMPNGELQGYLGVTGPQWQAIRKSPVVEDSFLQGTRNMTIGGSDLPEDVLDVDLTSNAFNFLGVPAALGRTLQPSDAIDGQDPQPVVVLGYKFWQRHFNSDPDVLGKTMQLDHMTYTIVGVAGRRFAWGDGDVYLPLKVTGDQTNNYYVGIRLKPGVTHAQADAALQPLVEGFAREDTEILSAGKTAASRRRSQRTICERSWRNALSAVRCGCPAAADWLRQRLDSASRASHRPTARIRGAIRDRRQPDKDHLPVAD